jgi:hypothetical protein
MKEFLNENMTSCESGFRIVLGSLFLIAGVFTGFSEMWVALIAIYPVITAIMAWDPFYAVVRMVLGGSKTTGRSGVARPA